MSRPEDGVMLDIWGDGTIVRASVPIDASAGWLVLDRNSNGVVDGVQEMFSGVTRLASGKYAEDGYAALREFDGNGDGRLSAVDPSWKRLAVWFDRNRNGSATQTRHWRSAPRLRPPIPLTHFRVSQGGVLLRNRVPTS